MGQSLNGKVPDNNFRWSVALSSEGKTLAIGAPGEVPAYVEVYEWDEVSSVYKRLGQSLYGDEECGDWFGQALALAANGRVLAVGAPLSNRNDINLGRVEVFDTEL